MRRACGATVAALAALLLAASAGAQDFEPVVGGGSFNAAPILEPGRYRDTLLPTEYLYYAFRLEAGQRLHVTANAELTIDQFTRLLTDITAELHSPSRDSLPTSTDYDVRGSFRTEPEAPLDITGPYTTDEPDDATRGPWRGPGVYYLTFYAIYTGAGDPPRAEVPFHFEVEVEGEAQETPTPSPSPSATPTATATPTPRATPAPDASGPEPAVAAGFGVGGLLAGVVAGIVLRRRRA